MKGEDSRTSYPVNLEEYRAGRLKRRHIDNSMAKAREIKTILEDAGRLFNMSSARSRQIIAYALNDTFKPVCREELDRLKGILRSLEEDPRD